MARKENVTAHLVGYLTIVDILVQIIGMVKCVHIYVIKTYMVILLAIKLPEYLHVPKDLKEPSVILIVQKDIMGRTVPIHVTVIVTTLIDAADLMVSASANQAGLVKNVKQCVKIHMDLNVDISVDVKMEESVTM